MSDYSEDSSSTSQHNLSPHNHTISSWVGWEIEKNIKIEMKDDDIYNEEGREKQNKSKKLNNYTLIREKEGKRVIPNPIFIMMSKRRGSVKRRNGKKRSRKRRKRRKIMKEVTMMVF